MNRPTLLTLLQENHRERIVAGPGCCHYHDHFYDLLVRIDPAQHFVPDPTRLPAFAGTYVSSGQPSLVFQITNNCLIIKGAFRQGQKLPARPGLALDDRRFVYEDFGLVTFQPTPEGSIASAEWWNETFTRIEG